MRAGGVHFDRKAEWHPDLEQELLTFPRSVHDDQVDALAWLGLTLNKMQVALSPEELEDEDGDDVIKLQDEDDGDYYKKILREKKLFNHFK